MNEHVEDCEIFNPAVNAGPCDCGAGEMPAYKYGRHECLDRSMLALEFVESYLLEHEGLMTDEYALAEKARDALFRLHLLIGERRL